MRNLSKGPKPQILQINETIWTEEYVRAADAQARKNREKWRHLGIKEGLRHETLGKCAYCEGSMEDLSFMHVEHLIPKASRPELAHRWENLTAACGVCNVAKDDFYHPTDGILNPYVDDTTAYLRFLGALIDYEPRSDRGNLTTKRLKLNRFELVKSRMKRLEAVRSSYDAWERASEPLKSVLAEGIRVDALEGEFTMTVQAYLRSFDFPLVDAVEDAASCA